MRQLKLPAPVLHLPQSQPAGDGVTAPAPSARCGREFSSSSASSAPAEGPRRSTPTSDAHRFLAETDPRPSTAQTCPSCWLRSHRELRSWSSTQLPAHDSGHRPRPFTEAGQGWGGVVTPKNNKDSASSWAAAVGGLVPGQTLASVRRLAPRTSYAGAATLVAPQHKGKM
jgi:hypothetical protein